MFQAGSCTVRRDAQLAVADSCVLAAGHPASVLWDCSPAIQRVQDTGTPSYRGDAADLCPGYATVHVRIQHPRLIEELQALDADLAAGIAALLSRSASKCLEASNVLCMSDSCAAAYAAVWSSVIKDCFGSVAPDSLVQPLVQRVLQQGWTMQHQRSFEFILPDPDVQLREVACVQADTASSSAELLWQVLPVLGRLPARITPQSIASAAQHAGTGSLLAAWSAARRALQAERNRAGDAGLWLRQVEADWPLGLRVTAVHGALDVLPFALVPKPSTAAVPAAEKHKKHKRSKTGGAADSGLVLEVDATGTPTAAPASTAGSAAGAAAGASAAAAAASPVEDGGASSAVTMADGDDVPEHHHGCAVSAEDLANLQLPVPGSSGMVQLTGIFVQADVVCGSVVLEDCHMQTPLRAFGNRVMWAEDPGHCHAADGAGAWLRTLRHIRDVPPEARLRLRVCAASDPAAGVQLSDPVLLSQVLLPLSDSAGAWLQGRLRLTMWPGQADLRGCPPGEFVSPEQVHSAFTAAMEDSTAARAEARAQGRAPSSDQQSLRTQAMQPVQWCGMARSGSDLDSDADSTSPGAQAAGTPASPPGAPQRPPPAPAGAAADQAADLPPGTPLDTLTAEEEQETRAAVLHAIRQASDGASSDKPRRSSAAPSIDSGSRRRRPTAFKADILEAANAAVQAEIAAQPGCEAPAPAAPRSPCSSAAAGSAASAASAHGQSASAAVADDEAPAWLVPSTPQEPWMHAYCKRPVHIEVELDLGALPLVSDEAPAVAAAHSAALRMGVLHSVPPSEPSAEPASAALQQAEVCPPAQDSGLVQCPQPYEMRARMLHIAALLGVVAEQGQLSLPRTRAARQALHTALRALPGLPSTATPLQQALRAVSPAYLAQWRVVDASQVPTLVWPRLAQWVARVALATQLGTAAPGRKLSFYDSAYGEARHVARPGEHDPAAGLHGQLNHKFMEHFHVSMDKRGWMRKLGAHMLSRWHRRWFVLSETKGTLCYFESNMSSGEEPRGVIDLQGKAARPVPKKNRAYQRTVGSTRKDLELHCFEVYATAASDRIFHMYCETQQEMESWVDAINTVAAAARRRATVSAAGASRASVLRAMSLANLLSDSAQRASSKASIESGGPSQASKDEQARQQLAEQVADLAEQSMHVCAAASVPARALASPDACVQEWARRRRRTRVPSAVVAGTSLRDLGGAAAADPQGRCVSHPGLGSGLVARATKDQRDQAALCLDAIYAAAEASAAALQSAALLKVAMPGLARVLPGWEYGASEAASVASAALSQSPATGPQPGSFADAGMPLLWSAASPSSEQLLGPGAPAVAWTLCAQQCAGWPDAALQLPVQSSVPRRERDTSVRVKSASVARAAAGLRSARARGSGAASPVHGDAPAGSPASPEWQLSLAGGLACIARDPGAVAVLLSAAPAGQLETLAAALRAAQAGQPSDEHIAVLHRALLAAMGTAGASQAPAPDVLLGAAQSAAPAHAAHLCTSPIAALIASAMVSTTGAGPELAASVAQAGGQLVELWGSCLPKLPPAFAAALHAASPGAGPGTASPAAALSAPESAIGQALAVRVWAASFAAAVLAAVHRTSKLAAQWCSTRVPDMFADESTRLDESALARLGAAGTAVTAEGVLRAVRRWLRSFTAVVLGHAPELPVPPGLELALKHLKLPNRAVFCVGMARASAHKEAPGASASQPARTLLSVGVGHHANAASGSWLAWEARVLPDAAAEALACVAPPAADAREWWQGLHSVERGAMLAAAAWLQGRPGARSVAALHTEGAWLQVSECVLAAQATSSLPGHGWALPLDGSGSVWHALAVSAPEVEGAAALPNGGASQSGAGPAAQHLTPAMLPPALDQPARASDQAQQQLCSVLCGRQASHMPVVDLAFQPDPAAGAAAAEAVPGASPGASTPSSVVSLPGRKATQSKVAAASSALDVLSRADPLTPVPIVQRMIVFEHRVRAMALPETLPKIATCVAGASRRATRELHRLLYDWATLPRARAREYLQLLDDRMADMQLRHFAAHAVAALSDDTIALLAPQLIQALKAEPFLHNSLLQMLLLRLRSSPCTLAIPLFWAMEVEASSNPASYAAMAVSMRVLTTHAPPATRALLCEQQSLWGKNGVFAAVCRHVQEQKGASAAKLQARARQALGELATVLKSPLTLPLDARMRVGKLVVDKCKVMDSAKLPLWLTFEHPESPGELLRIIFKAGDDIRQDMLTLQLVRAMDAMWKSEGMDLAMTPYACTATWNDGGLLQIVPNSATLAQIQVETGGKLGAFRQAALAQWLADQCGGAGSAAYAAAVDRFVRSCAGYCVAMYVLGIGDRHNDNIMMTEDGRLFHIDFGHILGYKKYAGGFSRERTGFVFTPEMLHVMGGKEGTAYLRWKDTVGKALVVLRKHATELLSVLQLSLHARMPELRTRDDIGYLRERLRLDLSDDAAVAVFLAEADKALSDFYKRLDNTIHILVHA